MNSSRSHEAFRDLLTDIANTQPTPPGPHVADDDDLLARWSAGYLSEAECRGVTDHLAACRHCSKLVAQMVQIGALTPPLTNENSAAPNGMNATASDADASPHATPKPSNSGGGSESGTARWRPFLIASLAAAAALVAAFTYFGGNDNGAARQLAMAQTELARGASLDAFQRVEGLLGKQLSDPARTAALDVAKQAAEQAALERLGKAEFPQVIDIATRADRLGVASDQLVNSQLQARRGDASALALSRAADLLDYGYSMKGESILKSAFPTFDAAFESAKKEWEQAIEKHPASLLLKLNYGQFLLKSGMIKAAEDQFVLALAANPTSVEARLGLGLARYEQREYAGALEVFESLMRDEPRLPAAFINAAMSSQALERNEDASRYWRQARELVADPMRRAEIDEQLKSLENKQDAA
ncbi:MAG: hypothetical protein U1A77_16020 [Pirellulales bacterium]